MGCEVYAKLKSIIKKRYGQDATNVGDEGGFAPNIQNNEEGLDLLVSAIDEAGYNGKLTFGSVALGQVVIGMDVAASEFYTPDGQYNLDFKTEGSSDFLSGEALGDLYMSFIDKFPIVSIEDPFDQDDWSAFANLTAKSGVQVCRPCFASVRRAQLQ
eukprot:scaffold5277_cov404-Prasinococcus_capsulatus_cf.AAC.10